MTRTKEDEKDKNRERTNLEGEMAKLKEMFGEWTRDIMKEIRTMRNEEKQGRNDRKKEFETMKTAIEQGKIEDEKNRERITNLEKLWKEKEEKRDVEWNKRLEEVERKAENTRQEMERRRQEDIKEKEEMNRRTKELEEKTNTGTPDERQIVKIVHSEIAVNRETEERKERKNNIIITGFKIKNEEQRREELSTFINEIAEKNIKIKEISEVNGQNQKLYRIKLEEWEDKQKLITMSKKLKGQNIYINNDLTRKEDYIQKKIRDIARKEREAGKRTRVGFKRIWIDDREYKWCEEEEKLKDAIF